eukprot:Gb_02162 [translate_table: standard]
MKRRWRTEGQGETIPLKMKRQDVIEPFKIRSCKKAQCNLQEIKTTYSTKMIWEESIGILYDSGKVDTEEDMILKCSGLEATRVKHQRKLSMA